MPSDTERKQYVYFKGVLCEWLGQAKLFGKPYYDIMYKGMRKTVPASACKTEKEKESKND